MSKSVKKHMGGSFCSCRNIKNDRQVYHRIERSKVKRLLKEIKNDPENYKISDRLNKSKIDYDLKWADNWSWSSDGGSVLMETDASLSNDFCKLLNSDTLFENYQKAKAKKFQRHWRYCFNTMLEETAINLAPEGLSDNGLKYWINANREYILSVYKKLNYGK